jgi:hypothetical protein
LIIWLASFPRSGNTLLRQVLSGALGLGSYSDEPGDEDISKQLADVSHTVGLLEIKESWKDFYKRATQSDEVFLVKTHRPPTDNQPAIYVIRDGRKALLSYEHYHRRCTPSPRPDLLGLVLGMDYYGGWTEHFQRWVNGRRDTLVVGFEELVNPTPETLLKLAEFTRSKSIPSAWNNPFDQLQARNPGFFREGRVTWEPPLDWTPWINSVYMHLHGDLMLQRGYVEALEVESARNAVGEDVSTLLSIISDLIRDRTDLRSVCDDRLAVIDGLKAACDERLGIIESFSRRLSGWVR